MIHVMNLDDRLSALDKTRPDCLYFAITLTADDDGKIIVSTQTQWVGWSNEDRREELRCARLVYPKFSELWKQFREPYAVIHSADELSLFLLGGGNALVEEELGKHVFSDILGVDRSIPDGAVGFVSPSLLPQTAFRRVPTPNVRMQVLKRDRRRCRICGRGPDDHLDLVLHVHHIRPWKKGGITDPKNLITLCHTCHTGLEPHDDHSLFDHLRSKSNDPTEEKLRELLKGVANYRRVGFLSGSNDETRQRSPRKARRAE
jgi:5-methylcytosine-specific restriction endonuclease McrA